MKDKLGNDLEAGDLMLVSFESLIDLNDIKAVFKSYDNAKKIMTYYPITPAGLEVAKFDAGESQSGIHRQRPFTMLVEPIALLKVEPSILSGHLKSLYNQIAARL
jgi:hypothetical protein